MKTDKKSMEKALHDHAIRTGQLPEENKPTLIRHESGAKIEVYTGKQLLQQRIQTRWLIEGFLRYGDIWLIKAKKKQGKTVMVLQLAFTLSTGGNLFDFYPIDKPCKVLILASEMVIEEWSERIKNMSGMCKVNLDNIYLMRCYSLALFSKVPALELLENIKALNVKFDVLFIDPVYKFFAGGDVNNTKDSTTFSDNVDYIKDELKVTIIEVHHDSEKNGRTKEGKKYDHASDENAYGNTFLTANVTHFSTLKKKKSGNKCFHSLVMGDERSGGMVNNINLRMVIPQVTPGKLGFVLNDSCESDTKITIREWLERNKEGMAKQICADTEIVDGTFRAAVHGRYGKSSKNNDGLIAEGKVEVFKKNETGNINWYRLIKSDTDHEIEIKDKGVYGEIGY